MKNRFKWVGLLTVLAIALVPVIAQGSDIRVKGGGPSGQGSMIFYAPSTGTTNMEMTTAGLIHVVFAETPTIGPMTVGSLTVQTNVNIGGKTFATGVISNAALTASLPVFTDSSKQLVSGTTGSAVTNATVGGGVLSGVSLVVTNGSLSSGTQVDPSVTNGSITLQYQIAPSLTSIVVQTGLMYDSAGGTCTNEAGNIQIPTNFVLQYAGGLAVTNTLLTLQMAVAPALTNSALTLQTGTPAVSTPTITLTHGTVAKP